MIERTLEKKLKELAKQYPVLTLTGPRQSGKTTICKLCFPHHQYVNLENLDTRQYANEDPRGFLAQFQSGVILDEVQRTPDLPSYIQGIVDEEQKPGRFILTGSQQFEVTNTINQSLAGRTAVLKLLPFSYEEIYQNKKVEIAELLYTGFYPRIHDKHLHPSEALDFYLHTYIERDLRSLLQVKDLTSFELFLRICASNIGQTLNYSSIGNEVGIDQKTVKTWLSILEASFIIFLVRPHFQNFRKRLVKSPKLFFHDVGLAAFLLGIKTAEQINLNPLKGFLFENFVIAEFLKNCFHHAQGNNLYFFRDHTGNEVDLVLDEGTELIPIEIKSGKTLHEKFLKGIRFYKKLSGKKTKKSFLIYGGSENFVYHETHTFPYFELAKLFEQLRLGITK